MNVTVKNSIEPSVNSNENSKPALSGQGIRNTPATAGMKPTPATERSQPLGIKGNASEDAASLGEALSTRRLSPSGAALVPGIHSTLYLSSTSLGKTLGRQSYPFPGEVRSPLSSLSSWRDAWSPRPSFSWRGVKPLEVSPPPLLA